MPGPTVALSASPPPADAVPSPVADRRALALGHARDARRQPRRPTTSPCSPRVPADSSRLVFHVNTKESYLEIRDGDRLVACFPITPGSTRDPDAQGRSGRSSPRRCCRRSAGTRSVLMTGKRSDNAFELPPGPNNPVGITWIALDRPGIGMHGTSDPDTIGRSASHGCIRLSNWDAFKVYGMVDARARRSSSNKPQGKSRHDVRGITHGRLPRRGFGAEAKDVVERRLLGPVAPYFDEPFYVGFQRAAATNSASIPPARTTAARSGIGDLLGRRRTSRRPTPDCSTRGGPSIRRRCQDVGDGIKVAAVIDPSGQRGRHHREPAFLVAESPDALTRPDFIRR